jgi:hypothetical protein
MAAAASCAQPIALRDAQTVTLGFGSWAYPKLVRA